MEFKRFGDIVSIKKGKKIEQVEKENNTIRYIQIDDLRNDNNLKYCNKDDSYITVNEKDIVIAWDGANAGTVGYGLNGAIGSTLAKLEINDTEFNTIYCALFLRSKFYYLREKCTGATIPHLSRSSLEDLKLPKLNIDTQNKIVEILDKSQELIDKRKEQMELLDELIQSKFIEMFGNPVTNPKRWEKDKLSNKCNIITGNTPSRKVTNYYGNYIEWIKSDNISNSNVYLSKAKEYLSEEGAKVGRIIEKNNILMTCIAGSKKCIGNVAINNRDVAFNQQINGIEVLKNNVYFMFHQFLLSQDYIQSTINMSLKGILSKGQLSELEFIFPPIELQEEFAVFVEKVNDIKIVLNKSLEQLNDNFDSLMQKAFKGELF